MSGLFLFEAYRYSFVYFILEKARDDKIDKLILDIS